MVGIEFIINLLAQAYGTGPSPSSTGCSLGQLVHNIILFGMLYSIVIAVLHGFSLACFIVVVARGIQIKVCGLPCIQRNMIPACWSDKKTICVFAIKVRQQMLLEVVERLQNRVACVVYSGSVVFHERQQFRFVQLNDFALLKNTRGLQHCAKFQCCTCINFRHRVFYPQRVIERHAQQTKICSCPSCQCEYVHRFLGCIEVDLGSLAPSVHFMLVFL